MKLKKIALIIITALFVLSVLFFQIFGMALRDMLSPHVTVRTMETYLFSETKYSDRALSNDCLYEDESGVYVYRAEINNDTEKNAYFAKKVYVDIGSSNGEYAEIISTTETQYFYIINTGRVYSNGERVVIDDFR